MPDIGKNHAVNSPTGMIHAVRPWAPATACGQDYRRKRFGKSYARNGGWTKLKTSFEVYNERRAGSQICKNCLENLAAGTGPTGTAP